MQLRHVLEMEKSGIRLTLNKSLFLLSSLSLKWKRGEVGGEIYQQHLGFWKEVGFWLKASCILASSMMKVGSMLTEIFNQSTLKVQLSGSWMKLVYYLTHSGLHVSDLR